MPVPPLIKRSASGDENKPVWFPSSHTLSDTGMATGEGSMISSTATGAHAQITSVTTA